MRFRLTKHFVTLAVTALLGALISPKIDRTGNLSLIASVEAQLNMDDCRETVYKGSVKSEIMLTCNTYGRQHYKWQDGRYLRTDSRGRILNQPRTNVTRTLPAKPDFTKVPSAGGSPNRLRSRFKKVPGS
ncbi:MAG: hypothetical protein AAGC81_17990 [Pseudomonadota bacterium]